jgi:protoheme IX farnesyltransferase
LSAKVNEPAAYLAAATVAIYVFIYTPLKRMSSVNTLVGAIPGAIPPVIGWVAAGGALDTGAWFLFALLFVWQLPHFVAINWLCREEYEAAGYKMWSNGDVSGRKTGTLAVVFSLVLAGVSILGFTSGLAAWPWVVGGVLLALVMAALAARFAKEGGRAASRRLFLFTLLYLPIALGLLAIAWK